MILGSTSWWRKTARKRQRSVRRAIGMIETHVRQSNESLLVCNLLCPPSVRRSSLCVSIKTFPNREKRLFACCCLLFVGFCAFRWTWNKFFFSSCCLRTFYAISFTEILTVRNSFFFLNCLLLFKCLATTFFNQLLEARCSPSQALFRLQSFTWYFHSPRAGSWRLPRK